MPKTVEERPIYQPKMFFIDLLGRNFSRLLLLFLWISVFYMYNRLPEIIPTHFNMSGEVDDYGNKLTLFLIPILGSVLFVVMSILLKHPEKFNYPVKITLANAQKQYTLAVRLIRWLNVTIMIVFNGLLWLIYYSAVKSDAVHAMFIAVLILLLTIVPLVIYFIASYHHKL